MERAQVRNSELYNDTDTHQVKGKEMSTTCKGQCTNVTLAKPEINAPSMLAQNSCMTKH